MQSLNSKKPHYHTKYFQTSRRARSPEHVLIVRDIITAVRCEALILHAASARESPE